VILSARLNLIFENLIPREPVWDFCCDHGYLGTAAARSASFSVVKFVDQVPHIITALEQKLAGTAGFEKCEFKAIDGAKIGDPVSGNLVIAGVGAHTISEILEGLHERRVLRARRLILSPQRDELKLRQWLQQRDWRPLEFTLSAEHQVLERTRDRYVFILDRSK
jgi:tRNA (adenine22-N1)-methyltransferase